MTDLQSSLSVSFAVADAGLSLSVEIDSRADGLNKGVTTFYPGDSPGFLVFPHQSLTLRQVTATQGSIQTAGSGEVEVVEWLSVANESTASLKYPAAGLVTVLQCYGTPAGQFVVSGNSIRFSGRRISSMQVRYRAAFKGYRLTGAPGNAPVVVYVEGVAS